MTVKPTFMYNSSHENGYYTQEHSHKCHEIVFYSSGCNGTTFIDGTKYNFKPGDIAVNRSGCPHSESFVTGGKIKWIGFECDNFFLESKIYHDLWDSKLHFDIIFKEMINQPYKYEEMISHKLCELLLIIERTQFANMNENKNLVSSKNFIAENYMQSININDLAKSSGYSPAHFRHLFVEEFGLSPQNYLIEVRCIKAIELLKQTNLTCAEIAAQCGFYDSSQLSKMLKERFSVTPLSVRKQNAVPHADSKAEATEAFYYCSDKYTDK